MAKFYDHLDDDLQAFIAEQNIFFTATAPQEGRINLSPKGMDSFRCLDAHTVAYLNLTGSGNETAAHVLENGRITIMFCALAGKPLDHASCTAGAAACIPATTPNGTTCTDASTPW